MDYRKKKNLIWKGESFLFFVVLLVFGAIFAAIHTGGLIQKQDSVQLLNKGWYYIKDGKKQEITLPAEIPAKTGEKLILYNESLGAESRGMTVVSTGAQYDLVIRLNGKILYEYKEAMFSKNVQMRSKVQCIAALGPDVQLFCASERKICYRAGMHRNRKCNSLVSDQKSSHSFRGGNDHDRIKYDRPVHLHLYENKADAGQTVPGCGTVPYDVQYLAGDGLITGTKLQQMPRSIMSHFFLYVHAAGSSDAAFFAEYRKHEKIQAPGSWNLYILSECFFTGSSGDPRSL